MAVGLVEAAYIAVGEVATVWGGEVAGIRQALDSFLISGVLSWSSDWFIFLRRLPSTLNFSLGSRKLSWPSYRLFVLNWDPAAS